MSMLLHCGANSASLEAVRAVPVPATDSWRPIPYGDIIDAIKESGASYLNGYELRSEGYALTPNGARCFGQLSWKGPNDQHGPSIAFRQSYNQTLAIAWAGGAQTFVCDNLALSGSSFREVRKNTRFAWQDFQDKLRHSFLSLTATFEGVCQDFDQMRESHCPAERGYALIGVAMGRKLLSSRSAARALKEWRRPSHADFEGDNYYGLYQAMTEGLKTSGAVDRLTRQTRCHSFICGEIASSEGFWEAPANE